MTNRLVISRNVNKRGLKLLGNNATKNNYKNLNPLFRNILNSKFPTEFEYKKAIFTSQKNAELAMRAKLANKKNIGKAFIKGGNKSKRQIVNLTSNQQAKWNAEKEKLKRNIAIARGIKNETFRNTLLKTKNAKLISLRAKQKKYLMLARNKLRKPLAANSPPKPANSPNMKPIPAIKIKENAGNCSAACIRISKMPLRDHQKRVCKVIRGQRGMIVVHSVGTGKTLTAVTASQCFLNDHPGARVIVLTPLSLIDNFKKAMLAYGISNKDPRYQIMSHQAFLYRFKKAHQNKIGNKDPLGGNMVIIDEAHNFRTQPLIHKKQGFAYDTDAKWMIRATRTAARVLCLTATPFVNNEKDILNLIAMTKSKDVANNNKTNWKGLFSFYERDHNDPNFPRVNMYTQEIKMTPSFFNVYEELFTKAVQDFPGVNISTSERFLLRMRQLVGGYMKQGENPKSEWTLNKIVEALEKRGRVVVYASFRDTGIGRVEEQLKKFGIGYNAIHGDITRSVRTRIINEYNSGESPVLLITQAGGQGIDLKETSDIILFDIVWNPANEAQIIGRGVRFGSHTALPPAQRVVNVHRLALKMPIADTEKFYSTDSKMIAFVESKRAKMEKVMNEIRTKYSIERGRA
jgi:superfamily II DNA or RNA helicase